MEVVNGLFGHLNFYSSGLRSLEHAKELVRLAQLAVQNAKFGAAGESAMLAETSISVDDARQSRAPASDTPPAVEVSAVNTETREVFPPLGSTFPDVGPFDASLTPFSRSVQDYFDFERREDDPDGLDATHPNGPMFFRWRTPFGSEDVQHSQNDASGLTGGYGTDLGLLSGTYCGT
jgi:hypothetical protein